MLAAIFRVVLKAFGERTRFLTLPGPGFRQVELDADFLRQVRASGGGYVETGGEGGGVLGYFLISNKI